MKWVVPWIVLETINSLTLKKNILWGRKTNSESLNLDTRLQRLDRIIKTTALFVWGRVFFAAIHIKLWLNHWWITSAARWCAEAPFIKKTSSTLLQLYIKVSSRHSENTFLHEVWSYAEKHRNSETEEEKGHSYFQFIISPGKNKSIISGCGWLFMLWSICWETK